MTMSYLKYTKEVSQAVKYGRAALSFVLFILLICPFFWVASANAGIVLDTSQDNWAIIGGYGQSFPGWGRTTQRIETIDLIPRYNHRIFDNIGSGWYRGFHSILLEVPVSFVVNAEVSTIIGMNFLASYTFTADRQWQPYLFGGGGPVYSFADIQGMGSDFNGNYQFGIGMKHDWDKTHQLLLELRYHHISNGGSSEPNDPLNSVKILFGFTF